MSVRRLCSVAPSDDALGSRGLRAEQLSVLDDGAERYGYRVSLMDARRVPEPLMHRAARIGDIRELDRLAHEGGDLDERADVAVGYGLFLEGLTPLMVAARSIDGASVETLDWLVAHGASPGSRSAGGVTATWYAAGKGARLGKVPWNVLPDHVDRLRYLLDLSGDPNEAAENGRGLLAEACRAGDPARVALLLDRGASIHGAQAQRAKRPSFGIPLFMAAESGSASCVRLLLEKGVDPNDQDDRGYTPLMSAGSRDVVRALVEAGANIRPEQKDGDPLRCALERFDETGDPMFELIADELVALGADRDRVDGWPYLRVSDEAFQQHARSVEYLLRHGAPISGGPADAPTPLHLVAWQGAYEEPEIQTACVRVIEQLVDAGVPVDSTGQDTGRTPLHEAVAGDGPNPVSVEALLRKGANPDPGDANGETPLMLATEAGDYPIVETIIETLIRASADPLRRDATGRTAVDRATTEARRRVLTEGS